MGHYLVTGAAGFIGSHTARTLLDDGHTVVGIDNLNDAYDVRVKNHRLDLLRARPGFVFVEGDLARRGILEASPIWESRFDAVVHLAARAGVRTSVRNPWVYVESNVTATLNLLELSRERGIPKFVLASTSSLYGSQNPVPYREDQDTSRPLSPYAASKMGAETLCHSYHALHGLDVSVLRYFTVYGPAGRPDMSVFRFIQRIREGRPIVVYGDGSMARDFTYVDDVVRGTILALRPLGYEVMNLGCDEPHSIHELIELIETALDRKAVIHHEDAHPADVPRTWASIEKACELLGWEPTTELGDGISHCVAWYERERDWAKDVVVY